MSPGLGILRHLVDLKISGLLEGDGYLRDYPQQVPTINPTGFHK